MPGTNVEACKTFLKLYSTTGPWVLQRISTDRTRIGVSCFTNLDEVDNWVLKYNQSEKDNLYFQVNEVASGIPWGNNLKKIDRAHISRMTHLHVDIDPEPGKKIEEEQERIEDLLRNPINGIPQPTFINFSGGGYQAFWQLLEAFEIRGDEELYEQAKLYNLALEQAFGADACHNLDRVMRLPGTINWPTERKAKLGRFPALAKMVNCNSAAVYPLSAFTAAQAKKKLANKEEYKTQVKKDVEFLKSVDELGKDVKDSVKALIVQGAHRESGLGTDYESDSEAVWYVVCELARCDVPDEKIYAVLTDPGFGISKHVRKQPDVHRYAVRQINRAQDENESPELRELNDQFALIQLIDGSPKVLCQVWDDTYEREVSTTISIPSFKMSLIKSPPILVGKKEVSLADWWLRHPKGKIFKGVCFRPNESEAREGYYNLWQGLAYGPQRGEWDLLRDHIEENICQGNLEYYNYLIRWMARGVQMPGLPGYSAVVMRSDKEGTGKSFLARAYGKLFGIHGMYVSSAKHVVGNFNAHLKNVVFLFADEAFSAKDSEHESRLRALVTEGITTTEKKGVDTEQSRNCISLMMASNNAFVVPAGLSDRRFFVLDVGDARLRDGPYFQKIDEQLEDGGYEAMLYDLASMNLGGFDVREIPVTYALQEQKKFAMSDLQAWWYECLCTGQVLHNREWADFHPTDSLVWEAKKFDRKVNSRNVANLFRDCAEQRKRYNMEVPDPVTGHLSIKKSLYGWCLKPIEACIEAWEDRTGFPVERRIIEDMTVDITEDNPPDF